MSLLYSNPSGADFDLEDPVSGTIIPFLPYHLVEDSYAGPSINLSYEGGSSATMTYIVPSVYHARFCQIILGLNYVDDDGDGDRLFRTLPHRLPIDGDLDNIGLYGYNNMFAVGIQNVSFIGGPDPYQYVSGSSGEKIRRPTFGVVDNDTNAANLMKYAYAKVTVQYGPVPYPLRTEEEVDRDKEWRRFTTIQRTPRVEFLNVKAGTLKWIDVPPLPADKAEVVPDDRVPIRDQTIDYVVTWHRVPFCVKNFDDYIGRANDEDNFLSGMAQAPALGFNSDTMLLVGVQEVLLPNPWGDVLQWTEEDPSRGGLLYNYTFFFQYKPFGHNAALRRTKNNTVFKYNKFSFTGSNPSFNLIAGNPDRAIKHVNMADLFRYGGTGS